MITITITTWAAVVVYLVIGLMIAVACDHAEVERSWPTKKRLSFPAWIVLVLFWLLILAFLIGRWFWRLITQEKKV